MVNGVKKVSLLRQCYLLANKIEMMESIKDLEILRPVNLTERVSKCLMVTINLAPGKKVASKTHQT